MTRIQEFLLISKLDVFFFNEWYCQFQRTDSDIGKIVQCDVTFNTDKNNNVSLEGLNISYRSRSDTSDNVCLNLQSSCYSTYILFSLV